MQHFITSDKFQDPSKSKTRHNKQVDVYNPSPVVIKTLLAYAVALHVYKTKSVGNFNVLMN